MNAKPPTKPVLDLTGLDPVHLQWLERVKAFQREICDAKIHVGMSIDGEHVVRCVYCREVWPCSRGASIDDPES